MAQNDERNKDNKSYKVSPKGFRYLDKSGRPVPASEVPPKSSPENIMSGPARGVIMRIHLVNSAENLSNALANQTPATREIFDVEGGGYLTRSPPKTNTRGYRMEADVKLIEGVDGFAESGTVIPRIPVALSFGGVENYSYVVPRGTTNGDYSGYTGKENGDYCLIQFIGGDFFNPIITNILPHRLNTSDAPDHGYDNTAFTRINGTVAFVDERGNFQLDATQAAEIRNTSSNTGVITTTQGDGSAGMIEVVTRNDISLFAGYTPDNKGEGIPAGAMSLVSSKDLKLLSQHQNASLIAEKQLTFKANEKGATITAKEDVSVLSEEYEVLINSKADESQVKVQNIRGSLRPAARKNDKVKITEGNDGDLFEYLGALHGMLEAIGATLDIFAEDPGAKAAGEQIKAFVSCHPKPTWQEGKIIEGSAYCQIAGKGTGDDIGEDESGIVNAEGEQVSQTELLGMQLAELPEVSVSIAEYNLSPNPINLAKGIVPGILNKIADKMMDIPPTKPIGILIQRVSPYITLAMEMASTGSFPTELPGGGEIPDGEDGASFDETFGAIDENEYLEDGVTPNPTYGQRVGGKAQDTDKYREALSFAERMKDYAKNIDDEVVFDEEKNDPSTGLPPLLWSASISAAQLESEFGPLSALADYLPTNPDTGSAYSPYDHDGSDLYLPPATAAEGGAKNAFSTKSEDFGDDATQFGQDWLTSTGILPAADAKSAEAALKTPAILSSAAALIGSPTVDGVEALISELSALGGDGGSGEQEVADGVTEKLDS